MLRAIFCFSFLVRNRRPGCAMYFLDFLIRLRYCGLKNNETCAGGTVKHSAYILAATVMASFVASSACSAVLSVPSVLKTCVISIPIFRPVAVTTRSPASHLLLTRPLESRCTSIESFECAGVRFLYEGASRDDIVRLPFVLIPFSPNTLFE